MSLMDNHMTTKAPPRTRHIGVGHFKVSDAMRANVAAVLDSGQISYGPFSLAFERRFAELHGAQYAILSNSGTSSLQVALQAMKEIHGWQRGDQVIVPASTFVSSANIVLHNGMRPVFVDVNPRTYNIDVDQIERYITDQTRAIMPVSLFGQPADLSAVREIADRHRLKVLHDSCECMFQNHLGKPAGQWADISAYSFYNAHLVTAGVGGMSLTDNPDYAAKMRSGVNHGLAIDCLNPGENFSPQPATGRRFRFDSIGHSFRITELEAALGLAQLGDLEVERMLKRRRGNAHHLRHGLARLNADYGDPFQLPYIDPKNYGAHWPDVTGSAWMMMPLVLKRPGKESLMAFLNERGVETRDLMPILNQPAYRYLHAADYPVSANMIDNGLYVGCGDHLDDEDIGYLIGCFGEWLDPMHPNIYKP